MSVRIRRAPRVPFSVKSDADDENHGHDDDQPVDPAHSSSPEFSISLFRYSYASIKRRKVKDATVKMYRAHENCFPVSRVGGREVCTVFSRFGKRKFLNSPDEKYLSHCTFCKTVIYYPVAKG